MVSPHVPSRLAYLSPKGAPMFFHGPGCALDRTKDKKRMGPHVLRRWAVGLPPGCPCVSSGALSALVRAKGPVRFAVGARKQPSEHPKRADECPCNPQGQGVWQRVCDAIPVTNWPLTWLHATARRRWNCLRA